MANPTLSPSSFHPVLRVTFPSGFFSAGPSNSPSSTCDPYLLLSLPPALFLDPWQEPIHPILQAQAHSQAQTEASASRPAGKKSSSAAGVRIEHVEFLSAGYPSQVELEKAVGWTGAGGGATYSGRGIWQGKDERTRTLRSSSKDDDEVLSSAGGGSSKKQANREGEAVLLRLSSSSASSSSQKLRLPLHARYLPPVSSSQSSLASRLLSPTSSGNYIEVAIEGLEVFWACTGGSAPRELEEEENWERLARPSSLLPSTHLHLLSPLLSSLPPKASIYKPSSSLSIGGGGDDSQALQGATTLPSLLLPTGDAELAQFTWGVTQAVIWIVAIWILMRVRSLG